MCHQTESAASLLDNDRVVGHFPENVRAKSQAGVLQLAKKL